MKRVFLSHRIDFLSPAEAKATYELYRSLLAKFAIEIVSVATSLEDEVEGITDAEIVGKCLSLLKQSDFIVFDCSIENWNYIGCVFEVAYAYQMQKPIIVYTGTTSNSRRPWLRFHATKLATTKEQVVAAVADVLQELEMYEQQNKG